MPGAMVGVSMGVTNACAWNAAGDAWCVGDATYGQIGDGNVRTNGYSSTPYQVGAPYKY